MNDWNLILNLLEHRQLLHTTDWNRPPLSDMKNSDIRKYINVQCSVANSPKARFEFNYEGELIAINIAT